jgi:hypothetical protein
VKRERERETITGKENERRDEGIIWVEKEKDFLRRSREIEAEMN